LSQLWSRRVNSRILVPVILDSESISLHVFVDIEVSHDEIRSDVIM
jgi:hypothetical protein